MKRLLTLLLLAGSLLGTPASGTSLAGLSAPDAVSAGVTGQALSTAYRFSDVIAGKPVRWNPCAAIHYRLNVHGAPAGGLAAVRSAIARIGQVTGTHWVQDGTTSTVPTTAALPRSARERPPVVIGWTDAAHSDLLRGQPRSVLGVTRTAWFGHTTATGAVVAIRGAVIALDRTDNLPATGALSWRSVTLHELGHTMGLDHAGSAQLMYPVLGRTLRDLQAGDLAGLRRLGRSQGCINL